MLVPGLFVWDSNPFLGQDKLVGHMVITVLAIFLIKRIGIWDIAGFTSRGFKKGIVLGIPFILIGIIAGVIGNIGVDWLALFVGQCFIGGESVLSVAMTIQQGGIMIILGAIRPLLISFYLLEKAKLQKWQLIDSVN